VRVLAALRSALSVVAVLLWTVGPGILMLYGVVVPAGWLMPRRRRAFVSAYMRLMSRGMLGCMRLGGARLERSGTLHTDEHSVIVMNHQSLLDIPTLVLMSWPHSPAFVTRMRYARNLPPVSTCVRLIGSPTIDPRKDPRAAVELMRRAAPEQRHGVVLFPEGHRSRDGNLRPFKSAGAEALLGAHPMPVWVAATDGFWSSRRLIDFVFNVHRIRGRTQVLGRLPAPASVDEVPALLRQAREAIEAAIQRMRAADGLVPEALADVVRARALSAPDAEAAAAARALAEAAEGEVDAVLFFGSRRSGARPEPGSAYDFFAVVRDERRFYEALRRHGLVGRSPWLLAALGRVLPPTSISLTLPAGSSAIAVKCAVSSRRAFARDTSARRRDHFTIGRLFQPVSVVWARDEAAAAEAVSAVARAHALTFQWARPFLPARFDAEAYARTLLRVSFAGEVRPEPVARRVETLWLAQQEYLLSAYGALLAALEARGDVSGGGDGTYALARPASRWERARLALYFRWSMLRATARWGKHVLSFEGWLDFLVRKARRHSGQEIVLSERERRAPLVFLWPRVWRYLRHKDR
jgi:1-acyl-sn-glycerol-3-phosphate acyltransferase